VAKLRNELIQLISRNYNDDYSNLTGNVTSGNQENDYSNLTGNITSGNQKTNGEITRTYITKDGIEAKMRVGNIGQGQSNQSPDNPVEDINEERDNNEEEDKTLLVENEDKPVNPTKPTKGKEKITNPLSIGDRVRIKDNHYFGGKQGVVTQISSVSSLVVAFDNDQRELIRLQDLDLPSLSKPQKPQKKEILIKEGLNYKAGQGCKWYVEVEEEVYKGLQIYQKRLSTPTLNGAFSRFLVEKGILKTHPDNPTKLLDLEDTTPTLKALNLSITTLNLLQQYINQHGEEALRALL
jgi:hypothetical protein